VGRTDPLALVGREDVQDHLDRLAVAPLGADLAQGGQGVGRPRLLPHGAEEEIVAHAEGRDDYAKTFLIVAPNLIVFERLRSDFGGGRVFRTDPIIPPELRIFWEMDFYMRGDPERASS